MERHLTTGVSTIVALMAAHRAASGGERERVIYSQDEISRIYTYLYDDPSGGPGTGHPRRRLASLLSGQRG
jgi:hypothetical protein